ncbi:hypothetical protein V5N11_015880 [Cardamine amara subsp. amara]|uniref:Uncharacterized protein n=1 Tax=Cardamine amara subsp. amara TaxID=228776 RepID=A0ABD1BEW8_CARAN
MNFSEYYTTLKNLWDDLDGADCVMTCHNCKCCKATNTKAEHSKNIKFLAGLNDSYSTIRINFIMKKTVPELGEIYNILDQDHSQRNIGSTLSLSNASSFNMSAIEQFSINAANHSYNNNPKQHKIISSHCGYTVHTIDKCYKIHGYPARFKHKIKCTNAQEKP